VATTISRPCGDAAICCATQRPCQPRHTEWGQKIVMGAMTRRAQEPLKERIGSRIDRDHPTTAPPKIKTSAPDQLTRRCCRRPVRPRGDRPYELWRGKSAPRSSVMTTMIGPLLTAGRCAMVGAMFALWAHGRQMLHQQIFAQLIHLETRPGAPGGIWPLSALTRNAQNHPRAVPTPPLPSCRDHPGFWHYVFEYR
jgi:hypothetical protein